MKQKTDECRHRHCIRLSDHRQPQLMCVQCGAQFQSRDGRKAMKAPQGWEKMDLDELVVWYARVKLLAML